MGLVHRHRPRLVGVVNVADAARSSIRRLTDASVDGSPPRVLDVALDVMERYWLPPRGEFPRAIKFLQEDGQVAPVGKRTKQMVTRIRLTPKGELIESTAARPLWKRILTDIVFVRTVIGTVIGGAIIAVVQQALNLYR